MRTSIVLAALLIAPAIAYADLTAAELQARGEELAKSGRFTEAIDAFKAADHTEQRASHACLIALAYTRREAWPQAELWLSTCHDRATPTAPLPEWVPEADTLIRERLAAANVAAVTIEVTPLGLDVVLTASSFAPDESFKPRTIYLPPGHHVVVARVQGAPPVEKTIEVLGKVEQRVVIDLTPVVAAPERTARTKSALEWFVIGGALVGVGAGAHLWMAYEWNKLDAAKTDDAYTAHETHYDVTRAISIGGYALGAAAIVTGIILHTRRGPEAPAVAAQPIEGGALATISWIQ